ncbi:hypothetical protein RclHR1_34450001 [Rhizophagus clarus]|uniref:Uncharacterized protein n=1 Tax=Rhizophagus clarus TaxID=94130 RepID=A0A2Z6RDZ9_9GLOM|nr:hypothetical protein RclHR1_34450001 [Rhizophagus clarus]
MVSYEIIQQNLNRKDEANMSLQAVLYTIDMDIRPGRSRKNFWRSVAENVNNTCGYNYIGQQCQTKFNGLVTNYHDQLLVIANDSRGVRSHPGVVFFNIMNTRFWEKLDDQFVQASIGPKANNYSQNTMDNNDTIDNSKYKIFSFFHL